MLHTLLEWVSRPGSRLLLVGIANTMDLAERLMQRTQSRFASHSIVFPPYRDNEVAEILRARLLSVYEDEPAQGMRPWLFVPVVLWYSVLLTLCVTFTLCIRGDGGRGGGAVASSVQPGCVGAVREEDRQRFG